MNFQQLRFVREAVRQNFNLTDVASALFATQPGVSRSIKELEDELGIEIFVRRGKRLLGLTEPGRAMIDAIERILLDANNLKRIAEQFAASEQGSLVVATTHTQARYALPPVIKQFRARYPKVHLALHQGSPKQIAEMLLSGEADIGVSTEVLDTLADIVTFPYYTWHHCVVVPVQHPLAAVEGLTLEALAAHPIITYEQLFTGRSHIDRAFAAAGVAFDVVLTAIDADVIKTYVELGLGVGIIAPMALDPARDQTLRKIDASHLFAPSITRIGMLRGNYLRSYAHRFVQMMVPGLSDGALQEALGTRQDA
jgi:LysR family cys regulon transcriptional activator